MPHSKVYIAVPNTGNIRSELVIKLLGMRESLNCEFDLGIAAPVDNNRNAIARRFLKSKCTHLWFIDSDIVPPSNWKKLFEKEYDVIGATCFSFQNEIPYALVMKKVGDPKTVQGGYKQDIETIKKGGTQEVECTGFGCLLIKREVVEAVVEDMGCICSFVYAKDGQLTAGEDFVFCSSVIKCGYKIFIDLEVLCDHFQTINLKIINKLLTNG